MTFLSNGATFSLREPKASTASIGRVQSTCSDLWLQNPAESLVTIKGQNKGKIPPGTCQMMKNEFARIMSIYPSESNVQTSNCNKLQAPNFELSGEGPKKNFTYFLTPSRSLTVPFDGQNAWPDYTLAKITENGIENRRLTEEFRQKHQRHYSSDTSKDNLPRWDLNEMLPCMTTNMNSTEECNIQKAAVAARYYYSEYRQYCMKRKESTTHNSTSEPSNSTH